MKRYGVKVVLAISMVAWALRFGSFGLGNPGEGLWLLIFSMIVYGVAFDFFNIAGAVYLERETDKSITASAQGLWMMMSNGIGASVGTVLAGYVVEHYCHWQGGKGSMAFLRRLVIRMVRVCSLRRRSLDTLHSDLPHRTAVIVYNLKDQSLRSLRSLNTLMTLIV